MVTINIKNRDLYLISAIALFLVGISAVVAYNPNWKTAPGNPAVMGHTIDEIDSIGLNDTIDMRINLQLSELSDVVNCNLLYDSMNISGSKGVSFKDPQYTYTAGIRNVPAICLNPDLPCIIKQEIYDKTKLKYTRFYDFYQASNNKWSSDGGSLGTRSGTNGDTSYIDIISVYDSLKLRDDYVYSTKTVEKDPLKWTFTDYSSSYGMLVSICSTQTPV